MLEMTPAQCHNAREGHSTPGTSLEMIPETQRSQVPLEGAGGCGEMEEREEQRDEGSVRRGRTGDWA